MVEQSEEVVGSGEFELKDDARERAEWALVGYLAEHDADCPECGYNLRGLKRRWCPECGVEVALGVVGVEAMSSLIVLVVLGPWVLLVGGTGLLSSIALRAAGVGWLDTVAAKGTVGILGLSVVLVALGLIARGRVVGMGRRGQVWLVSVSWLLGLMVWLALVSLFAI